MFVGGDDGYNFSRGWSFFPSLVPVGFMVLKENKHGWTTKVMAISLMKGSAEVKK